MELRVFLLEEGLTDMDSGSSAPESRQEHRWF